MRYILHLRALVNIKQKEKAESHLARLFDGIAAKIDGRYWKDQTLWEGNLQREVDFPNDYAALWATLSYLRGAAADWMINSGPNDASCADVVSGVYSIYDRTDAIGMVWCSFELLREGALDAPATAIDV